MAALWGRPQRLLFAIYLVFDVLFVAVVYICSYLSSGWPKRPHGRVPRMISKWICAALALVLVGCVTPPSTTTPSYTPKTEEQINQDALNSTIDHMKQRGASQADIDNLVAYSKLSFEEKLRSGLKSTANPAYSLVSVIDTAFSQCDIQRQSLKIPISYELTTKTKADLAQCVLTSSRVISEYYYQSYLPAGASEPVRVVADETYLKWRSYFDSIVPGATPILQEQAALALKDQIHRTQLVFIRESQKAKKK